MLNPPPPCRRCRAGTVQVRRKHVCVSSAAASVLLWFFKHQGQHAGRVELKR
uniref:Uncharacterized protein n=1 Tax=Hyaloperonospora arabidopsidis (strain Emoy2) TaxID=559515 RepID=M4B303_HYAAE